MASGSSTTLKDSESSSTTQEMFTPDSGVATKQTAKEPTPARMVVNMKETGLMTSNTESEERLGLMAPNITDTIRMVSKKEQASIPGPIRSSTKENGTTIL